MFAKSSTLGRARARARARGHGLAAIAFFAGILPATAHAAPPAAVQTCAACHGAKGVSSIQGTPSLAAQPDIFIQYQLVFMRDGTRDAGVMKAIVKTLSDDNIRDLGAYYASLPPPPARAGAGDDPDAAKIAEFLQQRHCDSCHKEDFSGQGETGRLAGQRSEYLVKALSDFRAAKRRGRGMGAMMEVTGNLSDQNIQAIAAYLAAKP
jgi:cytochrome c553